MLFSKTHYIHRRQKLVRVTSPLQCATDWGDIYIYIYIYIYIWDNRVGVTDMEQLSTVNWTGTTIGGDGESGRRKTWLGGLNGIK